jgi:hypothetical protein
MKRGGHQLLTRVTSRADEDGNVGIGDLLDGGEYALHCHTAGDDLVGTVCPLHLIVRDLSAAAGFSIR